MTHILNQFFCELIPQFCILSLSFGGVHRQQELPYTYKEGQPDGQNEWEKSRECLKGNHYMAPCLRCPLLFVLVFFIYEDIVSIYLCTQLLAFRNHFKCIV